VEDKRVPVPVATALRKLFFSPHKVREDGRRPDQNLSRRICLSLVALSGFIPGFRSVFFQEVAPARVTIFFALSTHGFASSPAGDYRNRCC
jgi:hypothetical protein